jgi:predicted AlkP superfamily phosphohydrolase/phosphomutase
VNGILIGGFLCPTVDKVAYPSSVNQYLRSIDYQIDSDPMLARESKERMIPNIHKTLDTRTEAMFHFLAQEQWDYFHAHVMTTDRLHHFLIRKYAEGDEKFAPLFVEYYRKLDSYLGKLLDTAGDDCGFVVMSDHGFCPIVSEVQLSRYLVEKGWTALRDSSPTGPLDIDPARSRAYTLIPGRIFVNVRGREPDGIVPPEEFEQVREQLAADLLELRAPNGDQVVEKVFKREELYWGSDSHAPETDIPLDELLSRETTFGKAADLIAIPFDGYDLKMGLAAQQTFVNTELEGMHTYHDAVIMARGIELPPERFSVVNVARYVLKGLGVEPAADMD